MWLDVAPRTDTICYVCFKEFGLHAQNLLTSLISSMVHRSGLV